MARRKVFTTEFKESAVRLASVPGAVVEDGAGAYLGLLRLRARSLQSTGLRPKRRTPVARFGAVRSSSRTVSGPGATLPELCASLPASRPSRGWGRSGRGFRGGASPRQSVVLFVDR